MAVSATKQWEWIPSLRKCSKRRGIKVKFRSLRIVKTIRSLDLRQEREGLWGVALLKSANERVAIKVMLRKIKIA